MNKRALAKNEYSMVREFIKAITVSLVVIVICIGILAQTISTEIIKEENAGICVGMILLMSACAGTCVATSKKKENKMKMSLLFGCAYIMLQLLATGIIFGGRYHGIPASVLLVLCGCIVPVILRKNRGKPVKTQRVKKRYC